MTRETKEGGVPVAYCDCHKCENIRNHVTGTVCRFDHVQIDEDGKCMSITLKTMDVNIKAPLEDIRMRIEWILNHNDIPTYEEINYMFDLLKGVKERIG